ncbi:hypothetical protein ABT263_01775 [Kitasatospora sp. NPDC001603]|uniref:hypothetical protein n=1 Tax=Kitasatospora sp. NPDC001603 TaxID=3154388 RepID=UPI00332C07E9
MLTSRSISGLVADAAGWRTTYLAVAAAAALLAVLLRRAIPPLAPKAHRPYPRLPLSVWHASGSTARHPGPSRSAPPPSASTQSVNWAETTGSANSVDVSVTASYKFSQVFEASIQATYNHTWKTSNTFGETDAVTITSGRVGWIERGTAKQEATGWYEIHFGTATTATTSGTSTTTPSPAQRERAQGYVNTQPRPTSSGERWAHCHR